MKKSVFRPRLSLFSGGRASAVTGGLLLAAAALTQGCLQRDIVKQDPNTSNVYVGLVVNDKIEAIDLLFVIDNSVSMADKQDILKEAVPQMVTRLVNPQCVNSDGDAQPAADDGSCPAGYGAEFVAVDDIHIGVITSSLGGHGSAQCKRDEVDEAGVPYNKDDRGRLIPSMRPDLNLADPTGNGFLEWNGGDPADGGYAARVQLEADFASHVVAADERGCGFEAPLEAWYRFLVDPSPPDEIVLGGDSGTAATMTAVDTTVLAQREAFLRPKSLVAIVILSDENDCSAMDGGDYYSNAKYGWLVAEATRPMQIATPKCDENPNDVCCFSCLQDTAPAGCNDPAQIAVCDGKPTLPLDEDRANVRCLENKRRFGVDLLYPTDRYVDALSKGEIVDARTGKVVDNPLLRGAGESNKGTNRGNELVFVAGIVGLPWQDVATPASLAEEGTMEYLTSAELDIVDPNLPVSRWDIILGRPNLAASSHLCGSKPAEGCGVAPVPPLDPFMIESIVPRDTSLSNPITGDMIVGTNSNNPEANAINGHEAQHDVVDPKFPDGGPANDDLQYACIFPLTTPKTDCTADDASCDCGTEPLRNSPLCQPVGGGAAGTTQYWGKAYPGTRILQMLREFGDNSIVGSICPKITTGDVTDPAFGYNPAVQAIVDRLKEKLGGKCLPRELSTEDDGSVPCAVIEALAGNLDCGADGRIPVDDQSVKDAVLKQLKAGGNCDGNTDIPCSAYQMCQIDEIIAGEEGRHECLYSEPYPQSMPAGFCYVDPAKEVVSSDGEVSYPSGGPENGQDPETYKNPLVANCPATQRRLLRFVGKDTPVANSLTLVACSGDAPSADAPIPPPPVPTVPGQDN